jgi:hypothetical protein
MATYPDKWPKPRLYSSEKGWATRHNAFINRITEQDKEDLYNRKVTTRAIAAKYDVNESYVSYLFPGKGPVSNPVKQAEIAKAELRATRKAYRMELAAKVLKGELSTVEAADQACIASRGMARAVKLLRDQQNGNQ